MAPRRMAGSDYDYVIVGAGPAGLAAAAHLAKTNARVAVFDFRPRPENVFGSYPVVLNPRGLGSLEKIDAAVLRRVEEVGKEVRELHIVPQNRTVARVRTFGTGIMRDQAAMVLLEHCEKQEGISFFWGHKLQALEVEARTLTFCAQAEDVVVDGVRRLVAADGNRSRVRKACAAQVPGFEVQEGDWGFQLRFMNSKPDLAQAEVDGDFHYVLGERGYVCQQPNGAWSVSLRVLPGVDEEFLTAGEATEERVRKLRAYTEQYAGLAAQHLLDEAAYRDYYGCRAFDGIIVKCSCLNPAGWICLIGDAAHAVLPATGEGINAGLEDAAVLGAMAAQHPEDPFAAFDAEHRINAHALHAMAEQAREKVVSSPRQRVANLMVTIGLGVAKKLKIVEGTSQDFMLGELAKTVGVKPYAELLEMEARQSRGLRIFGNVVGKVLRISTESPLDLVTKDGGEEGSELAQSAVGA